MRRRLSCFFTARIRGFLRKLENKKRLQKYEVLYILSSLLQLYKTEPVLIEISSGTNICGDIHGCTKSLACIFERLGLPGHERYLFLGDYVDRGPNGIEVLMILFCYKLLYPQQVHMLRGNHENRDLSFVYGFCDECIEKGYGVCVWELFCNLFSYMPIAAIVQERIFCAHGGISPHLYSVLQLKSMQKPICIDTNKVAHDLVWSDPVEETVLCQNGWHPNPRGTSYAFGEDVVTRFLMYNRIFMVCRAHQCVSQGYEFRFGKKVLTVFSGINYCGEKNDGCVLVIANNLAYRFETFDASLVDEREDSAYS